LSDQASFHDLNIASHYCDEILYLHKGLTAGHGTLDAVFSGQMISRVFGVDTQLIAYPSSGRLLVSFNTGERAAPCPQRANASFTSV
jgi:iron complex transport system ATP-binding protein